MRILLGSIAVLLALQICFSYAKVIRRVKHEVHHHKDKRSIDALDLTDKDEKCVDHSYCIKYTPMDCQSFFLKNNCKRLCGLCGAPKIMKLPMVVYYNKGKTAGKKRVTRDVKPTYPPTTTETLFNYVGGYNNWDFHYTDKHPIQMDWSKPQPFLPSSDAAAQKATPAADQASNQAAPAQTNNDAATQTAAAQSQADSQAAAYPATQNANAFQPQTAYPEQNQQPAAAATATQASNDVTTIKVPNSALEQAKNGKDVYVALVDEKQNQTSVSLTSTQNDQTKQQDQGPVQSDNYGKNVGAKCPYGKCNYKGPNAPQVNHPFMVYCDDRFPSCGVLHSSCNDSWLQLYCPKRCNLCRPEDQQTKPMPLDTSQQDATASTDQQQQQQQQQQQTQFGNTVYPTKVSELKEDYPKMESELVAPEPGAKAERARYTLHVTPKLKDGVPQTQEILVMPPNAVPGSDVKPLVILKQKVTKPMVENIEIDVPPKGTKYSDEPKVEVIEGNNHESLKVVGGQADLSQAEADLASKTQQIQEAQQIQTAPAQTNAAETTQAYQADTATSVPAAPAAEAAPAQQPAAQPMESQTAQNTQAQYSQSQGSQTYQDTQVQATQTQASQPQATQTEAQSTQSYQDTQAQASQAQAAQPEATQTQATQTQTAQDQATETQATQTQTTQDQAAQTQAPQTQAAQSYAPTQAYAQTQAPAPTEAPATAQASAYPAQQQTQQSYTANQCSDDARCVSYTEDMCSQNWLQNHCKSKCKLC